MRFLGNERDVRTNQYICEVLPVNENILKDVVTAVRAHLAVKPESERDATPHGEIPKCTFHLHAVGEPCDNTGDPFSGDNWWGVINEGSYTVS